MTSERANAYSRVMATLAELGPAKLLPAERDEIRAAADVLLFDEGSEAERSLAEMQALARQLVDSGRWLGETADGLVADLEATGPVLVPLP